MNKLKPCPVCGGTAALKTRKARNGYEAAIQCSEGCVLCMTTIAYDTKEKAVKTIIKQWNSRTSRR